MAGEEQEDHDQRAKMLQREFLQDLIALRFPQWVDKIEFTNPEAKPEWLQQEVFPDPPKGTRRLLDVVVKVSVLEQVDGSDKILIHVENEAEDGSADLQRRMPDYRWYLVGRHNMPVLSLGVYLYVALEGMGWHEVRKEIWGERQRTERWAYIGLPGLDAWLYVEGANLLGVAFSVLMRCDDEAKTRLKARAMQRIAEAKLDAYRRFLLMDFVEAYLPLEGTRLEEYDKLLLTEEFKMARVLGQTTFEKGIEKGERGLVQKLLEKKFGPLSAEVAAHLDRWSSQRLLEAAEGLLAGKSLSELGLEGPTNGVAPQS